MLDTGFYYIALDRCTGTVSGFYYDKNSSPFQALTLTPCADTDGSSAGGSSGRSSNASSTDASTSQSGEASSSRSSSAGSGGGGGVSFGSFNFA